MGGGHGRKRDNIHETPDVSHIQNPDVAHEHTDVRVGAIAWFVFGLFVFGVVVCVLMLVLFNIFDRREERAERPTSPLARTGDERLPPEPRLQAAPGFRAEGQNLEKKEPQAEMKVVRQKWDEQLNTYDWIDQSAGTVRIPIEQAKKLMVKRAAEKARSAPPQSPQQDGQKTEGQALPAASSSGQVMEQRNP